MSIINLTRDLYGHCRPLFQVNVKVDKSFHIPFDEF